MSKGLEALKSFKVFTQNDDGYVMKVLIDKELKEKYDIIEKELKDKEKFEELINMDLDLFMKAVNIKGLIENYQKFKKALHIISQNFRLVGNCLHARNSYAEDGWVFVKEIEDEEEHKAWQEVLL